MPSYRRKRSRGVKRPRAEGVTHFFLMKRCGETVNLAYRKGDIYSGHATVRIGNRHGLERTWTPIFAKTL